MWELEGKCDVKDEAKAAGLLRRGKGEIVNRAGDLAGRGGLG